ncbi:hypothetical protein M404DRAFT_22506 [Pisolithus tinctorius Marx 270]|uniref:CCHC-type domain-containing protein n=1 Tax=Pisolithus tinctorius Marx 270 TaxID=870435 RepID=A0A0C3KGD8_PISTI|nr:hypothetical protein M404DRAFT_22506 [Pisolithus tinctorius Marx 270]
MSDSRPITTTDNNNKGQVIIDWTQVPDDDIRYDTDNEEEEQAWLEAKKAEREKAKAERAERVRAEAERAPWEATEIRVHKEEERQEAEHKCQAEARKGSEARAGASSSEAGDEVKKVVMNPRLKSSLKGKCCWPRDGKDAEASLKVAGKVDKGKKQKVNEENAEAVEISPEHPTLLPHVTPLPPDEGPDDDDNNNPDDDDPGNGPSDGGPSDDNLDENDLEDDPDIPVPDTEPAVTVFDNLAKAIKLLASNTCTSPESSSRTKLHEPDTFDVIFAQSYLKGMALEWFEPDLLGLNDPNDWPLWMDSWREFILELQTTFGPHNPVADAESQLDHLHMKDNQHINNVLHHHFYSSLPDQIKDEVCQVGKPWTLHELHHLTQEIDACYWEHKEEIQQASKHQGSSASSNNKSRGSGNNNQSKTSQEKAKTGSNNNAGPSPKPGNNSNSSKPEPSKLRKDGKLTPEECKCCIEGNLCMFCRGPGHFADKCPKKAGKAKACTAATTEAALASGLGSTPETKK